MTSFELTLQLDTDRSALRMVTYTNGKKSNKIFSEILRTIVLLVRSKFEYSLTTNNKKLHKAHGTLNIRNLE